MGTNQGSSSSSSSSSKSSQTHKSTPSSVYNHKEVPSQLLVDLFIKPFTDTEENDEEYKDSDHNSNPNQNDDDYNPEDDPFFLPLQDDLNFLQSDWNNDHTFETFEQNNNSNSHYNLRQSNEHNSAKIVNELLNFESPKDQNNSDKHNAKRKSIDHAMEPPRLNSTNNSGVNLNRNINDPTFSAGNIKSNGSKNGIPFSTPQSGSTSFNFFSTQSTPKSSGSSDRSEFLNNGFSPSIYSTPNLSFGDIISKDSSEKKNSTFSKGSQKSHTLEEKIESIIDSKIMNNSGKGQLVRNNSFESNYSDLSNSNKRITPIDENFQVSDEFQIPDDREYQEFLDFFKTADSAFEVENSHTEHKEDDKGTKASIDIESSDDEEDEDYDFEEDLKKERIDKEEFKKGTGMRISKKEINALISEQMIPFGELAQKRRASIDAPTQEQNSVSISEQKNINNIEPNSVLVSSDNKIISMNIPTVKPSITLPENKELKKKVIGKRGRKPRQQRPVFNTQNLKPLRPSQQNTIGSSSENISDQTKIVQNTYPNQNMAANPQMMYNQMYSMMNFNMMNQFNAMLNYNMMGNPMMMNSYQPNGFNPMMFNQLNPQQLQFLQMQNQLQQQGLKQPVTQKSQLKEESKGKQPMNLNASPISNTNQTTPTNNIIQKSQNPLNNFGTPKETSTNVNSTLLKTSPQGSAIVSDINNQSTKKDLLLTKTEQEDLNNILVYGTMEESQVDQHIQFLNYVKLMKEKEMRSVKLTENQLMTLYEQLSTFVQLVYQTHALCIFEENILKSREKDASSTNYYVGSKTSAADIDSSLHNNNPLNAAIALPSVENPGDRKMLLKGIRQQCLDMLQGLRFKRESSLKWKRMCTDAFNKLGVYYKLNVNKRVTRSKQTEHVRRQQRLRVIEEAVREKPYLCLNSMYNVYALTFLDQYIQTSTIFLNSERMTKEGVYKLLDPFKQNKWFNQKILDSIDLETAKTGRVKFSRSEDTLLAMGLKRYGTMNWKLIKINYLPTKTESQLMNRYKNMSSTRAPDDNPIKQFKLSKKLPLNDYEKDVLRQGIQTFGYDFDKISKEMLPHRKPTALKQFWFEHGNKKAKSKIPKKNQKGKRISPTLSLSYNNEGSKRKFSTLEQQHHDEEGSSERKKAKTDLGVSMNREEAHSLEKIDNQTSVSSYSNFEHLFKRQIMESQKTENVPGTNQLTIDTSRNNAQDQTHTAQSHLTTFVDHNMAQSSQRGISSNPFVAPLYGVNNAPHDDLLNLSHSMMGDSIGGYLQDESLFANMINSVYPSAVSTDLINRNEGEKLSTPGDDNENRVHTIRNSAGLSMHDTSSREESSLLNHPFVSLSHDLFSNNGYLNNSSVTPNNNSTPSFANMYSMIRPSQQVNSLLLENEQEDHSKQGETPSFYNYAEILKK